jgi:pimeloyl-ACP methyl ester carboxylesterase
MPNVVVVNGLWLPGQETFLLRKRIESAGFETRLFTYRSVADDLDTNAARLAAFVADRIGGDLHLVGHSLGGLVILRMLERHRLRVDGRIVCLGSPLRSSVAAEALAGLPGGAKILGRSMGAALADGPRQIWSGTQELGLLAGSAGLGCGQFICDLSKPHDGTVAVEETRLEGASDHVVLPVSHLSMLGSRAVAEQVVNFLNNGHFEH